MRCFSFLHLLAGAMGACRRSILGTERGSNRRAGPSPPWCRWRGITLALACLTIIAIAQLAGAQSTVRVEGTVIDVDDGSGLDGVRISLDGTAYGVISDRFGRFRFDNIPVGVYRMQAALLGFENLVSDEVSVVADVTQVVVLRLKRKPVKIPGIVVTGSREDLSSADVTVIDHEAINRPGMGDVTDVLESVEGVYVQQTGTGGQSQVRIRGCAARQVLVLVDGQRLNPAGSGIANLNSIPIETIEQITVHKGGASAEFGPDALGGVIEIVTNTLRAVEPASIRGEERRGSWDARHRSVSIVNPLGDVGVSSRLSFSSDRSAGDYGYDYTIGDTTDSGTRLNNESQADSYFLSGMASLSQRSAVRYSAQVYDARHGLPGKSREQNRYAFREDGRILLGLEGDCSLAAASSLHWRVGFSHFDEYFRDLETALPERYETRFKNDVLSTRLTHDAQPWRGNSVSAGTELQNEQLYHTDYLNPRASTGRTRRTTWSLFLIDRQKIELPPGVLFDRVGVDIASRFDRSKTIPEDVTPTYPWDPARSSSTIEEFSPKMGLVLAIDGDVEVTLRGNVGQSVRLPAINSLFWQGNARSSGNPDLLPERSRHSEGGVELDYDGPWYRLSAGTMLFNTHVEDLVVWVQAGPQGVWKPVNLGAARTVGHEDFVKLALFGRAIELRYQNSITDARNRVPGHNSYDKVLTYTPHYVTQVSARLNIRSLFAGYSFRSVGRRYTNEANTRWYDPYHIHDLTCGWQSTFRDRWQVDISYRIANVGNEQYVLIAQHPMPGRQHQLGVKLTYGLGPGNDDYTR